MAKKIDIPKDNNIIRVPIEEAMPDNYLPYAVEVAKDRALPDVRDGLKPVHRRILYGAYMLKAFPDKPYFKSARIVGDILGKYHPHGDASVYDSMVIMAQEFSTRKPLIDGHGNWGSIDGDNAAAMRYTEARLTPIALEMIKDLDKDVVDMIPNYSESELEPKVLPSGYPNLLVNGVFGIAVGLATNIPPHNLKEVINGLLAYIEKSDITTRELMEYIKGPDLPTGGILIGKNSILSAYETGEGRVTLRAKTSIEKLENGRLGIVITEFPYRKNKARLLQIISEMTGDKKHMKALENIADIRDESDRTGIRAVVEFKKSVDVHAADKVLKYLYKKTDLQCNLSFNMVAVANGKPLTMGIKTILMHYLNHRKEIITRRTKNELATAQKRFLIVQGFIKAIDILDQIIKTIRASKSKKDAQVNLINEFGFLEIQAEAILELMLYRLTGLEIKVFEKEYRELEKEIIRFLKILSSENELLKVVKSELQDILTKYGDLRRTEIIEDDNEAKIDLEELVIIEDIMITLSNEGYIKSIPLKSYNRSNTDVKDIEYREGDYNKYLIQSNTKDTIMFFTDKGNMYQTKGISIPEYKWKDKGEKVDNLIKGLNLNEEKIIGLKSISSIKLNQYFVFISNKGLIKKTSIDKFVTNYSRLQAVKLREAEKLVDLRFIEGDSDEKYIRLDTKSGLQFTVLQPSLEDIDRTVLGTQLVRLCEMDEIVKVEYVKEYDFNLFSIGISEIGDIKVYSEDKTDKGKRTITSLEDRLLVFTDKGIVYNIDAKILQNMSDKEINISNLVDGFDVGKEKVLNILSIKNFDSDIYVYFYTARGFIKKTSLVDFDGNYLNTFAYKFKTEADRIIAVEFGKGDNVLAIIITKKAMAIKFETDSINTMGRVASGVTGISLKEDDEVIYGALVRSGNSKVNYLDELAVTIIKKDELLLTTIKKAKKNIKISEIKLQNRAGRGSSVMLVVMDDYVKDVKNK